MNNPLYNTLDAVWRDGAHLASWSYTQGPNGEELPVMRVDAARQLLLDQLLALTGPNELVDGFSKDPERSIRPAARNEVRNQLRGAVREWAGIETKNAGLGSEGEEVSKPDFMTKM